MLSRANGVKRKIRFDAMAWRHHSKTTLCVLFGRYECVCVCTGHTMGHNNVYIFILIRYYRKLTICCSNSKTIKIIIYNNLLLFRCSFISFYYSFDSYYHYSAQSARALGSGTHCIYVIRRNWNRTCNENCTLLLFSWPWFIVKNRRQFHNKSHIQTSPAHTRTHSPQPKKGMQC